MKLQYRILIALAVVGIALLYYFYPCLMLNFKNLPHYEALNNDTREIVFLYGKGICGTCPTGNFLNSLEDTQKILFVPDNYTDTDIENFKDTFRIQGPVTRGKKETINFLENIAGCKRLNDWRNNYHVTLKDNKKFEAIKQI